MSLFIDLYYYLNIFIGLFYLYYNVLYGIITYSVSCDPVILFHYQWRLMSSWHYLTTEASERCELCMIPIGQISLCILCTSFDHVYSITKLYQDLVDIVKVLL